MTKAKKAEGVAQVIEHPPNQRKVLISSPRTIKKLTNENK
jgi:hypothetical protein